MYMHIILAGDYAYMNMVPSFPCKNEKFDKYIDVHSLMNNYCKRDVRFFFRKEFLECFATTKNFRSGLGRKRPSIPLIDEVKKILRTYYEDKINAAIKNVAVLYKQKRNKEFNLH